MGLESGEEFRKARAGEKVGLMLGNKSPRLSCFASSITSSAVPDFAPPYSIAFEPNGPASSQYETKRKLGIGAERSALCVPEATARKNYHGFDLISPTVRWVHDIFCHHSS